MTAGTHHFTASRYRSKALEGQQISNYPTRHCLDCATTNGISVGLYMVVTKRATYWVTTLDGVVCYQFDRECYARGDYRQRIEAAVLAAA